MQRLEAVRAQACELNNVQLYRLSQGLLWLGEGRSVAEVSQLLRVSVKSVYNWLRRFLAEGCDGLWRYHYRGRGRPSKLTPSQKQQLVEAVKAGPEKAGFSSAVWNTVMITEWIWRRFGVRYNPRYLSRLLKQLGLSYQKARFISSRCDEPDHEQARQQWREKTWPRLLRQAKVTGAVILFVDEVSFAMWGSLSYTWGVRGHQTVVKTKGRRQGLKMFGAIGFQDGQFHYREARAYRLTAAALKRLIAAGVPTEVVAQLAPLKGSDYTSQSELIPVITERLGKTRMQRYQKRILAATSVTGKFNAQTYQEFLQQLLDEIRSPIILVQDSVSYHVCNVIEDFAKAHADRLTIELLPTFSPDFNPIEKLWKNTKKESTHLKYFETFEQLRQSVLNAFDTYLKDASKVFCVMKKLRQQAAIA
jgi:transposase